MNTDHPPGLHWVLFEDDKEMGRRVYIGYDDKGVPRGAHEEQDIDHILAANALAKNATDGRKFGEWNRAASVPLTFMQKTGLGDAINGQDRRYMSKILNNSDYSGFRTSRGKV